MTFSTLVAYWHQSSIQILLLFYFRHDYYDNLVQKKKVYRTKIVYLSTYCRSFQINLPILLYHYCIAWYFPRFCVPKSSQTLSCLSSQHLQCFPLSDCCKILSWLIMIHVLIYINTFPQHQTKFFWDLHHENIFEICWIGLGQTLLYIFFSSLHI